MKQNIAENISSLYSQVTNQLFNEYKASSSISQKQNQYNAGRDRVKDSARIRETAEPVVCGMDL